MTNFPRMFAYTTGTFTVGVVVYLFTNMFFPFVQRGDYVGTLFLIGYASVYASVAAAISRRFVRKTLVSHAFPYVLIPVITVPAMILIEMKGEFALPSDQIMYYAVTVFGAAAGIWLGIRAGHKQREELIARVQQEQAQANEPDRQGRGAPTRPASVSTR